MDHNPPTMGDLAYGEAQRNQSELSYLRARVDELEKWREEVIEWSESLADANNDHDDRVLALERAVAQLITKSNEPCDCMRLY